jgi:hypothetical protein
MQSPPEGRASGHGNQSKNHLCPPEGRASEPPNDAIS